LFAKMIAHLAAPRQEAQVGEGFGVLLAIVSSSLGGTAAAVTRYLVGNADPLTPTILGWGIGSPVVLPITLLLRVRWPQRRDWLGVAGLGVCFFGLDVAAANDAGRGPRRRRTGDRANRRASALPFSASPPRSHRA
jgi:hypothetical protein